MKKIAIIGSIHEDGINYLNTNMVESLMLVKKKLIKGDLIIVYGDIFFDISSSSKVIGSNFPFLENNQIAISFKGFIKKNLILYQILVF